MNRLYKTLEPEQRKKLVEAIKEHGKQMHEHMLAMEHGEHGGPGDHGEHGPGMGGPGHEHGEHGGPGHEHGPGPGAPGAAGPGPGGEHGPGMGGPGHEHEMGPGMHGGGPLEKLSEELALTPEQKEKLKTKLEAQMKAQQAAMKSKMDAGMKHLEAIGTAFEGDKFDAKKAGVGSMGPDMIKAMAKNRVDFVQTVLGVLTPEQRAKFAEHVRAHAADPDMAEEAGG